MAALASLIGVSNMNEDPKKMSVFARTAEEAEGVAAHFTELLRGAALTVFLGSLFMWVMNGIYAPINMLFGLVFIAILFVVFTKPKVLLYIIPLEGFFAFLRDEDVSQGAAAGPEKLSKLGLFAVYTLSLNAIILATWSFWNNGVGAAMSYWGLWLVTIAIGSLSAVIGGGRFGAMAKKLQMGYLILVALSLVWNTLNLGYALPEEVSDANGNAVVMYNPQTRQIVADLSPADCTAVTPCFAADGIGVELIPLPKEEAERRNPNAWAGNAIGLTDRPLFWPIVLVLLVIAGYGYSRNRSLTGLMPAFAVGALVLAGYLAWPTLKDSNFSSSASAASVAMVSNTNCDSPEPVSIGSRVTLSRNSGPCLANLSERIMLVAMDEKHDMIAAQGALIDWSNPNAPTLKNGEFPESIEFVVAPFGDTTIITRNELRQNALFRL